MGNPNGQAGKAGKDVSIIGVIPQYSEHSKHNIYTNVKMPPVGIISVLSQIKHDLGIEDVYAIDENNYSGPRDFTGLPDHAFLQARKPVKIAMFYGGMSNSIPRMFELAQQYKRFGALTIAGGGHVDALPDEALHSGIDIVVHGEGERTTEEILETILQGKKREELSKVSGISFLDGGRRVFTGKREPIANLDELQSPDLTLIRHLEKRWSAIPISRGRGCNYNCEFCTVNDLLGPYRAKSVGKTLEDITRYLDIGHRDFFLADDNFAQDEDVAILLCRSIEDYVRKFNKKQKPRFVVQVRIETAEKDELLYAMKAAGVTTLAIGYESPINEELRAMHKGVTVEKMIERSRKLSKRGFYLHGMLIFGYPTFKDSKYRSSLTLEQKARAYEKFFEKAKLDTVQVLNAIPLPGSELRAKLEKEGRLFPLQKVGWDKYGGLHLCYDPTPEGLDPYELQNLPRALMKNWYLGSALNETFNPGNWMDWAYYATIGFPIQFGAYYTKRFVHNLVEKRREERFSEGEPGKNIFYKTLSNAWGDIKRKWRNLGAKTYGGMILNDYYRTYNKSKHSEVLGEVTKK